MARPPRTRRTRDETRQLLLDAAVRVVLAQTSGAESAAANPLAGVRITDALEEVNRQLLERDPAATQLTTGAVYNIWPAQEDFQLSLLEHILTGSSVPGVERVDATLEAGIAQGLGWQDLVAICFGEDFDISFAEPTMFVMIGLGALGAPSHIAATNERPNKEYAETTSALLRRILAHGGRRIAKGRTMEDLVWAIEAIEVGYLLRRRSHPDVTARAVNGRTVVQTSIVGLVEVFTEPADTPTAKSRPS
jgi:hypothetical protein